MNAEKNNSITSSMIWKTLERYSVLGITLIVQIIIARILEPEQYGLISMMTVFITIATVFIQNGFNMALIQMKEADENDYSTALWINIVIGCFLYGGIYFTAPCIASYYGQSDLVDTLRVLALILIIGSTESIQIAIASRRMQFKKIFVSNLISSTMSGIAGIVSAFLGAGVWALIIQQLTHKLIVVIVLGGILGWHPNFVVKRESAKQMFAFGWKMLAAGLVNAIYNELNSLIIGRKYSSDDLAYYTKGKQFPNYISSGIDSSIQSVMLSAFSKKQSDLQTLRTMMRKSIAVNIYVIFPMMLGLALISKPLITVLLTDKWIEAVPYMQICCITYALHPIASAHLQALAAIGRSDLRLKMEFIKKPIGIILLFIVINKGPFAIAISAVLTSIINMILSIVCSSIYVKLSVKDQLKDVVPVLSCTIITGGFVYIVGMITIPAIYSLVLQIMVGLISYLGISALIKPTGYKHILSIIKRAFAGKVKKT